MHWTDEDPGLGELDGLRRLARQIRERGDHASEMVDILGKAGQGMAQYWSGDAADAWADRVRDDIATYSGLHELTSDESLAIASYVDAVETIQSEAATATRTLGDAQATRIWLAAGDGELSPQQQQDLSEAHADAKNAAAAIRNLAERRRDADRVFVMRLRALSRHVRSAPGVTAFDAMAASGLTPGAILRRLSRLSPEEALAVLDERPELIARAQSAQPADVAAWWGSLSPDQQTSFIELTPQLIGNLDGVDFTSRNAANRAALAANLAETTAELAAARKKNEHVAPVYRVDTTPLETRRAALIAVKKSIAVGKHGQVPRFIVSLDLAGRPKAAVSVGNPDTATQVTVDVPGMGSTVGGSMAAWTESAANLYRGQLSANATYNAGRESGLATIAWIGYDAPDMPPSVQVLGSAKANAGGARLSALLEGVTATRGWKPGENLSVVAHSYGTTVAAAALTKTRVENFTMLASAGLSVTVVKQLKVPSANVWATQARGDEIANIGRGTITLGHHVLTHIPSTHRTDPMAPDFGGNEFSSEGSTVDGRQLFRTDGHSATVHIDNDLAGHTTDEHGYLDSGTTSLFNTSLASLGLGASGAMVTP